MSSAINHDRLLWSLHTQFTRQVLPMPASGNRTHTSSGQGLRHLTDYAQTNYHPASLLYIKTGKKQWT